MSGLNFQGEKPIPTTAKSEEHERKVKTEEGRISKK